MRPESPQRLLKSETCIYIQSGCSAVIHISSEWDQFFIIIIRTQTTTPPPFLPPPQKIEGKKNLAGVILLSELLARFCCLCSNLHSWSNLHSCESNQMRSSDIPTSSFSFCDTLTVLKASLWKPSWFILRLVVLDEPERMTPRADKIKLQLHRVAAWFFIHPGLTFVRLRARSSDVLPCLKW